MLNIICKEPDTVLKVITEWLLVLMSTCLIGADCILIPVPRRELYSIAGWAKGQN